MKDIKKEKKSDTLKRIAGVCLVVFGVLLIFFLTTGNTVVVGNYPEAVVSETLVCSSDDAIYPFFRNNDADRREMKISMIFDDDKLGSISMMYTLYVRNYGEVVAREAVNHAEMNGRFAAVGLGADALNVNYGKNEDNLKTSMYINKSKMDAKAMKFFLVDDYDKDMNMDDFLNNYIKQGFSCEING